MKASDSPARITLFTLQSYVESYDALVPSKIAGLEELRLNTVPETLAQRKKDNDAFLEKTEVVSLIEWKLYVSPTLGVLRLNPSEQQARHLPPQSRQIGCLQQRC